MSYCVHCGVELDAGAEKCVLCGTPVFDASVYEEKQSPPAYPDVMFVPSQASKRYAAFLVSVIMFIPAVVCGVINLLLPHTGIWALYVISTALLVWVIAIVPFLMSKPIPYLLLAFDTVATLGYCYFFYSALRGDGWFLNLALPLVLSVSVLVLIFMLWVRRKKRSKLQIIIIALADIAVLSFVTEAVFRSFYDSDMFVLVSVIIATSCVCLMLFALSAEKNKRFKAWLVRRFYI